MSDSRNLPLAAIFGISGNKLKRAEIDFFKANKPLGFILFSRNCQNKIQVKSLVKELKKITADPNTLILIDQEGGRVSRLSHPHWRKPPPAGLFSEIYESSPTTAEKAAYINYRMIAADLVELGINVNCAPMLDIRFPNSHNIIGDRALGENAKKVTRLGETVCKALIDGGVLPVIKHIPGHGRAEVDSHESLPEVNASYKELSSTDFLPFKNLTSMPLAMTAHIRYGKLDRQKPATLSKKIIDIIRKEIGFSGLIMTDDVSMKALTDKLANICKNSLESGCDIILHCNGKMSEMKQIAKATPQISKTKYAQLVKAMKLIKPSKRDKKFSYKKAELELQKLSTGFMG